MAFSKSFLTRDDKIPRDMFQTLTYDATRIPPASGTQLGDDDRADDIANATGAGYFPLAEIPESGALVKVKQLPASGTTPEVQLYVVNRVTIAAAPATGTPGTPGYVPAQPAYDTTRATAYGTAISFSTDTA